MAYTNFMSNFKGPGGGIGKKSWAAATAAGYNPTQIKTAIQQLHQNTGISVGSGVRTDHMQGVKGIAHGINKYQGPGGNLGLNSYNAAKAAGFSPQDIPMLAAQGGMFLPSGAYNQWQRDMQEQFAPPEIPQPEFNMPGTTMGGGAVLGSSALGVRSALGSQDNTGGTQDAFGRARAHADAQKKRAANAYAAQLQVNPLT